MELRPPPPADVGRIFPGEPGIPAHDCSLPGAVLPGAPGGIAQAEQMMRSWSHRLRRLREGCAQEQPEEITRPLRQKARGKGEDEVQLERGVVEVEVPEQVTLGHSQPPRPQHLQAVKYK